jgi:hypothetical protein
MVEGEYVIDAAAEERDFDAMRRIFAPVAEGEDDEVVEEGET